ncbi:MAG: type II toxin-antitoxin system HicA family toxin [Tepidisphaeraceae bacterium]
MSKLPRDVTGERLVKALARTGYRVVRQTGSHVRLKGGASGQAPVTVPLHRAIKIGTLSAILDDVAAQTGMTIEQVLEKLDL